MSHFGSMGAGYPTMGIRMPIREIWLKRTISDHSRFILNNRTMAIEGLFVLIIPLAVSVG
jgi:hypothetical protein